MLGRHRQQIHKQYIFAKYYMLYSISKIPRWPSAQYQPLFLYVELFPPALPLPAPTGTYGGLALVNYAFPPVRCDTSVLEETRNNRPAC